MAISAARSATSCANASSRPYIKGERNNATPLGSAGFRFRSLPMQSTVGESARHTVVVTVEVPPEEFARDLDRAYRRIGQQIKVPGFRKGHVPRRIIDAQVGRDAVMQEFVEDAIPQY